MKFIYILLLTSFSAMAIEVQFIGPCSEKPLLKVEVKNEFSNVGEITIATLIKYAIPFRGTEQGLASAFDTPTGSGSVEHISPVEFRAHGWCYSVDGIAPEVYPHETALTSETKTVTWHFGFARFYKGQWLTQCSPTWTVRPAFLCNK
jgi:hypothetical protein